MDTNTLLQAQQLLEQGKHDEAAAIYLQAANEGHPGSMRTLGALYEAGWGVEQSDAKAIEWYLKAAEKNDKYATFSAAKLLLDSKTVEHNPAKSFELLEKIVPDEELPDATLQLSLLLILGAGCEKNVARAWELLKPLSHEGNMGASMLMERIPMPELQKLVDEGDADALLVMGNRYLRGAGVDMDIRRAYQTFLKAAEADNVVAMMNVARMLERGEGTRHDYSQALRWYQAAADQGAKGATEGVARMTKAAEREAASPTGKSGCLPIHLAAAFLLWWMV